MSAADVGLRELQLLDLSAPLVEHGGLVYLSGIPLPAVLHSDGFQDDDDFMQLCFENEPLDFERYPGGEILVMAPAGGRTSNFELYIAAKLMDWAEENGNGIVLGSSGGFKFPDTSILAPDASWFRLEHWEALSRAQQEKFVPLCPDFLVELRSPSDRAPRIEKKMKLWMSKGVKLAWLIDPKRKLAIIYRPDREPETLAVPEFLGGEGPVAEFRLEMKRFWS